MPSVLGMTVTTTTASIYMKAKAKYGETALKEAKRIAESDAVPEFRTTTDKVKYMCRIAANVRAGCEVIKEDAFHSIREMQRSTIPRMPAWLLERHMSVDDTIRRIEGALNGTER